jgi:ribosomal protein S18 acetylase RimI-like enzyme
MFGKLELSDLDEIKAYLMAHDEETIYLKKIVEDFEYGHSNGNFYGEMHDGILRGLFYFSPKKVLALHFSDQRVLGSMGILKAIKLHKPQYIKGTLDQVELLYKTICRAVKEARLTRSRLMIYEGRGHFEIKEVPFSLVDGMAPSEEDEGFLQNLLQDLNFFIEVERYFGRPVKAVNDILKEFKSMLKLKNYILYLDETNIVAQGIIEEEGEALAIIGGIYVSEKHRSKGLGFNITSLLTKRVTDRNRRAALFVAFDNEQAIKLYEKIGYEIKQTYGLLTVTY